MKEELEQDPLQKDIEDFLFISIRNYVEKHLEDQNLYMEEDQLDIAAVRLSQVVFDATPDILSDLVYTILDEEMEESFEEEVHE